MARDPFEMHHIISASFVYLLIGALGTFSLFPGAIAHAQTADGSLQFVQAEVGMFIDSHGRRVYYDIQTNRIIAVEEFGSRNSIPPSYPAAAGPNDFPPPPAPPANAAPGLQQVERAPLDIPSGNDERRFRRLNEVLEDLEATVPDSAPSANPGPRTESTPEMRTAAIPRSDPAIRHDSNLVAKLQVLLDRRGISPGVIDGRMGSNVQKALAALRQQSGYEINASDEVAIETELAQTGGEAFIDYTITPQDIAGPFIAAVPADYAEKAKLQSMAFTSPLELLAERFHMDENYLAALNPDANFNRAGTAIRVASVGTDLKKSVVRIEADKAAEQVRAYDDAGRLVAAYPATIGSSDTPSPSGTVQVERIAVDPNYTYNPKVNFVQGENREILTIPPGPNGPVGSIWIALSKPTYGIHGTPEPARIGKTNSHGCVRLTNWDANELAHMVSKGVTVEFLD
jgi:lipoprotein-anchoring transpeptidase ErfK/SrfK